MPFSTGFIQSSYKAVNKYSKAKMMLHYLECPIQHRHCTETICNAFVVLCTMVLLWAEPRFLLGQKHVDSKAYKSKYSTTMGLHSSPEHSKWHTGKREEILLNKSKNYP